MTTAKCLKRQAATCASLADATLDEESRERYLRLEQLYLTLAESEDMDPVQPGAFQNEPQSGPTPHH